MTHYGLNPYWQNLLTRLMNLERRGVIFAIDDDAELIIRIPRNAIREPGTREGIKQDKTFLLEAVRLREGLCVTCGLDRAKYPRRAGKLFTNTPEEADCSSLLVCPTYCSLCWETRMYQRDLKMEKPGGTGNQAREKETGSDADLPPQVRQRKSSAPHSGGDSGGVSVEALAFDAD